MALAKAIAKKLSKVDSKQVDEDIAKSIADYKFMEGRTLDRAGIEKENVKLNALFRKTNKELEEIRSKKSADTAIGQQARNELDRRYENKMSKKGDIDSEYSAFEPFSPTPSKKTSGTKKTSKNESTAEESSKFKKGGMVTKKKAPTKAKAKTKATFSIKNNNFAK